MLLLTAQTQMKRVGMQIVPEEQRERDGKFNRSQGLTGYSGDWASCAIQEAGRQQSGAVQETGRDEDKLNFRYVTCGVPVAHPDRALKRQK